MDKVFIEKNKEAVIQEMGVGIENLNQIIKAMVETDNDESGELAIKKYMIAMSMTVGSLTSLFNEFYILHTGIIPDEDGERQIGFRGMIDDNEKKKKKSKKDEE